MISPIDCLGQWLMPGDLFCLAEDGIQKLGLVAQLQGTNGSFKAWMYRIANEEIVKTHRIIRLDQKDAIVLIALPDCNLLHRAMVRDSNKLKA